MAELSGLDRLWLGLLRGPLSWWARPHVLPDDLRRRYAQHDRPICYVLDVLGVADLVALEKVCARHGLPEPLDAFELIGAGAIRTRLQAAAVRGLTRFVGRQAEIDALHGALERAREGRGQVAALVGSRASGSPGWSGS